MKEEKAYLVKNNCYTQGRKRSKTLGVLVHDTATPGATIDAFIKSWNTPKPNGISVCVHAFVDDKRVVNTLPYDMRCWGCGSGPNGSGNDTYIQIEMIDPAEVYFVNGWQYRSRDIEKTKVTIKKTVENLCKWIVARLKELNIHEVNKETVTSHYEAHSKGIASGHQDPQGFLGLAGLTMDDIRTRCRELMNKEVDASGDAVNSIDELYKIHVNENVVHIYKDEKMSVIIGEISEKGIYTIIKESKDGKLGLLKSKIGWIKLEDVEKKNDVYLVKVTAILNIRSGPGTEYEKVGIIRDFGTYTIVETIGNWGKLKSGAGWIYLGYTQRV